ncbi:MAG: HAMP domain-containing protein [Planctomycetes bacterium]|nr:HAMP domain-containing protein [Planctomycetota bacterium]
MNNQSIRFKFLLFMTLLLILIGIVSCSFFYTQIKKQLEDELKKRGYSLIVQLAQDGEVKDSMSVAQKAFFEDPISRLRKLDRDKELAFWRVLLVPDNILLEENESWIATDVSSIPVSFNPADINGPVFNILSTDNGERFYNFVAPVHEKRTISDEEFAAQIFSSEEDYVEEEDKLLGVVQIGLSPRRINKKMIAVLWSSSIPLGFIIVLVGIGFSYFIARSVVKPVENLVKLTERVASGDLDQTVDEQSGDEIGKLASHFNKMTKSLKKLMNDKEDVMNTLRNLNMELSSINKELVQTNEQLNETQERLIRTEKLAAVGTLASGISHELRNPLGAIKNAVFFLKRKFSDEKLPGVDKRVLQFFDIMDNEVDRSSKIINDLLGFASFAKLKRIPFDITDIIEESLARAKRAKKDTLISRNFEPELPTVEIDSNQIGQVFLNLIENAFQAMEEGGTLQINTRKCNNFIEIEFVDSGCGISQKGIKQIFDPLFTTKCDGVGMGLAVCHWIIQKHEGTIDVKSKVGKGTSFVIRLPLAVEISNARED